MNHLNLSEFSVAFTIDLSNRFPPRFCGVFLIPRFSFRIKQWVEIKYTKVLVFVEVTSQGLPCKPDCITFLGSFLDDGFRYKLACFVSLLNLDDTRELLKEEDTFAAVALRTGELVKELDQTDFMERALERVSRLLAEAKKGAQGIGVVTKVRGLRCQFPVGKAKESGDSVCGQNRSYFHGGV